MKSKPVAERAFLYCRQSKTEGAGTESLSLVSQERILRDLAADRGFVVVGVEVDADLRGWKDERQRPGLAAVLDRAAASEYDVLLVYDLSRLARALRVQENVLHVLDRQNVRVISAREPWTDDPMFRQILGAVAEQMTRTLAAHAKRGLAERARRGLAHGPAPFGYVKRDGVLVPDDERPERIAIVRDAFRRVGEQAATVTEVCVDLNARGIPNARGAAWSVPGVRGMLLNAAYIGAVKIGDVKRDGAHEPIVEADLFARVGERLNGPRSHRRRRKSEASWLEGFVHHECGERAYLIASRGKAPYFRCLHASDRRRVAPTGHAACDDFPKNTNAAALEDDVWSQIMIDFRRVLDADNAIRIARRRYAERTPDAARRRRELDKQVERLDLKLSRAEQLYLDGARNRDWMNAQEAAVGVARVQLLTELDALPDEPDDRAIRDAEAILRSLADDMPQLTTGFARAVLARLGVVTFGPSGVIVWYAPEFAALIPGARSLGGSVTIGQEILRAVSLRLLNDAHRAMRASLGA